MSEVVITGDTILDIRHLNLVLNELKLFGKCNWQEFGLEAGLDYSNTLETIKADNPGSVDACFRECVVSWLRRKDNVDVKGKPTLKKLAEIVEKTRDRAAADEIRKTIKEKDEEERKRNTEYTGGMYHIKKEDGHCVTCYAVTEDLNLLKEYLKREHPDAKCGETIDTFRFIQPDGKLQLHVHPPLQRGWIVQPDKDPMIILQSTVDNYPENPLRSSCSVSVFAKPGIAQDPLRCPIELTGIDPETTIYINKPPPPSNIDNTADTLNLQMRKEEGTIQKNNQNFPRDRRENFERCYVEDTMEEDTAKIIRKRQLRENTGYIEKIYNVIKAITDDYKYSKD